MANRSLNRFFRNIGFADCRLNFLKKQESYRRVVSSVLCQYQSQCSNSEREEPNVLKKDGRDTSRVPARSKVDASLSKSSSDDDDSIDNNKWTLDLDWLTKAFEPAHQYFSWALPTGNGDGSKPPPTGRSLKDILASIQRSKVGLQDWSLSDLTIGLYLIYLRQASSNPAEDFKGVQISCNSMVQDLIYYTELANGAYKDNAGVLARKSMLRESNVVKFVKKSSILRPGYFIGIDVRKKLVILGIRGTHTIYDLITDFVSSSDGEVSFEGYSTHFGTGEAAHWFLKHEIGTLRKYLKKYEGFRLRLVGHSLGGATASLLAIMIRKKSPKELGFSPDIVSAIGFATPPCVSKELAERCSEYVTTVVMQDDIIPRLSTTSLARLRNEVVQTDWITVLEKEDWKGVVDLFTNAKQVVSSVQDVARKLSDYAKSISNSSDSSKESATTVKTEAVTSTITRDGKESSTTVKTKAVACTTTTEEEEAPTTVEMEAVTTASNAEESPTVVKTKAVTSTAKLGDESKLGEELFLPGTLYYLKRSVDSDGVSKNNSSSSKPNEIFTLWKRNPGEHFKRIVLSSNLISDHKCDSHYYALRDVLKGLPHEFEEAASIFI